MKMRWFLDMCILIYYTAKDNSLLSKKTIEFIKQKDKEDFLVCFYIVEWDLPKWSKRQKILIDEVIKKIKNTSYDLKASKTWNLLYPREKQKAEKIIFGSGTVPNIEIFIKTLINSQKDLELRLANFLKNKPEKVIPIEEIDTELRSNLLTYLEGNVSDANILASGIQEHNNKEVVLLTGDKEHWTKDNLEWAVPEYSELRKRYPKIPTIKYIQDL